VGVDANVEGLMRLSRRAAAPPARGGLPNLLLGRLALEGAPGDLSGMADRLTVLLPWGSLLTAVAGGDPDGLAGLRGLCAPGATVEAVVSAADLDAPEALPERYAEAGLAVAVEEVGAAEVEALGTTWAKRLARSDPERRFWRLSGVATAPAPGRVTAAGPA
jgi:hypothetical protein